ncbi:uncharacterized protein LOC103516097 isoform X2 [Diaphorina citri]|uniref:Uncharacterized protein LOC103516097 isoform X1 n=1 Tax=Diaphorina citri TaxID=121845 RepID=A0A1S3DD61_DIACI|nr:uncharacterized protein LOC103516097 isoform X1 [Diaphorina citri]XP_026684395.1 uncharacterized protein LOC103516097 isoform X2 [Diaphorina citri]
MTSTPTTRPLLTETSSPRRATTLFLLRATVFSVTTVWTIYSSTSKRYTFTLATVCDPRGRTSTCVSRATMRRTSRPTFCATFAVIWASNCFSATFVRPPTRKRRGWIIICRRNMWESSRTFAHSPWLR